jgi:hypothetical protein
MSAAALVLLLLHLAPTHPERQSTVYSVRGTIEPAATVVASGPRRGQMSIRVFFDGESYGRSCTPPGQADARQVVCSVDGPYGKQPTSARVEITAAYFKIASVNVPRLAAASTPAVIDVGTVTLSPSVLPRVVQVKHARDRASNHVFDILLYNPLKSEPLVTTMTLATSIPEENPGANCCCPPNLIFQLLGTIVVNQGSKTARVAQADYRELTQGKNLTYVARGDFEINACRGGGGLSLELPTGFSLPASEYTTVRVVIPATMKIVDRFYGFRGKPVADMGKARPQTAAISNGSVDAWPFIRFSFATRDKAELPIEVSYDLKTGAIDVP